MGPILKTVDEMKVHYTALLSKAYAEVDELTRLHETEHRNLKLSVEFEKRALEAELVKKYEQKFELSRAEVETGMKSAEAKWEAECARLEEMHREKIASIAEELGYIKERQKEKNEMQGNLIEETRIESAETLHENQKLLSMIKDSEFLKASQGNDKLFEWLMAIRTSGNPLQGDISIHERWKKEVQLLREEVLQAEARTTAERRTEVLLLRQNSSFCPPRSTE